MMQPGLKEKYDVIVIGAGVGGLTAAALLSKAGLSVCVLEKEPHAGGYLAGFRRKDFRFDTAIHWLNQYGSNGLITRLFNMIGTDYPKAVQQKRIRRYLGDNFDYLLTDDPELLKQQLIRDFPDDKKGIERFFLAAKRLGNSFHHYSHIFRSSESMSWAEKVRYIFRQLSFAIPFIPFISFSGEKGFKKGLRKFFKDQRLHDIFSSEVELLSCLIPIGWAYYGDFQCPPAGGGQVIPEWLQHVIESFQNHIYFKCEVKEIILDGKKAAGVTVVSRGKTYTVNSKYVIACCDVETLYEKMLPAGIIPVKLKQKLRNAELYSSSVTISIALDCPAESLGFNEELIHIVSEHYAYGEHGKGDPNTAELSILAPSQRDKTMAPDGRGTLTLFMPALMNDFSKWFNEKEENVQYSRLPDYKILKDKIAEILIKRVEKIAPGLRSHILFYDVATPLTHWRYTGNKNGTMMGAKPGRENMQNGVAHYRTPVENLLLGGHWAELGGGVPIAVKAGSNASLLVLKKENKKAFRILAAYMESRISLQKLQESDCFKEYHNNWKQRPTPSQKQHHPVQ